MGAYFGGKMDLISVIIIDDNTKVIDNMKTAIEKDTSIKLLGTASNGEEGLNIIKSTQPDVVVLDLIMPIVRLKFLRSSEGNKPV